MIVRLGFGKGKYEVFYNLKRYKDVKFYFWFLYNFYLLVDGLILKWFLFVVGVLMLCVFFKKGSK